MKLTIVDEMQPRMKRTMRAVSVLLDRRIAHCFLVPVSVVTEACR